MTRCTASTATPLPLQAPPSIRRSYGAGRSTCRLATAAPQKTHVYRTRARALAPHCTNHQVSATNPPEEVLFYRDSVAAGILWNGQRHAAVT